MRCECSGYRLCQSLHIFKGYRDWPMCRHKAKKWYDEGFRIWDVCNACYKSMANYYETLRLALEKSKESRRLHLVIRGRCERILNRKGQQCSLPKQGVRYCYMHGGSFDRPPMKRFEIDPEAISVGITDYSYEYNLIDLKRTKEVLRGKTFSDMDFPYFEYEERSQA